MRRRRQDALDHRQPSGVHVDQAIENFGRLQTIVQQGIDSTVQNGAMINNRATPQAAAMSKTWRGKFVRRIEGKVVITGIRYPKPRTVSIKSRPSFLRKLAMHFQRVARHIAVKPRLKTLEFGLWHDPASAAGQGFAIAPLVRSTRLHAGPEHQPAKPFD